MLFLRFTKQTRKSKTLSLLERDMRKPKEALIKISCHSVKKFNPKVSDIHRIIESSFTF